MIADGNAMRIPPQVAEPLGWSAKSGFRVGAIRKLSAFWDRSCYFFLSSAASTTDGRKLNCSLRLATSRARSSMRPASALRLVKRKRFAYSFRVQKFAA